MNELLKNLSIAQNSIQRRKLLLIAVQVCSLIVNKISLGETMSIFDPAQTSLVFNIQMLDFNKKAFQ